MFATLTKYLPKFRFVIKFESNCFSMIGKSSPREWSMQWIVGLASREPKLNISTFENDISGVYDFWFGPNLQEWPLANIVHIHKISFVVNIMLYFVHEEYRPLLLGRMFIVGNHWFRHWTITLLYQTIAWTSADLSCIEWIHGVLVIPTVSSFCCTCDIIKDNRRSIGGGGNCILTALGFQYNYRQIRTMQPKSKSKKIVWSQAVRSILNFTIFQHIFIIILVVMWYWFSLSTVILFKLCFILC